MADLIIRCGFQSVLCNFEFPNNKGQKLVESGHLFNVEEIKPKQTYVSSRIHGYCIRQTSVSSNPWQVTLEVS